MELYKKHRPRDLDEIIGQDIAVQTLKAAIDKDRIPHFILFTGPRGCGKTTLARIMRRKLHCSKYDFIEDAPTKVEHVRKIKSIIHFSPVRGKCRVWLIDECHKLTPDAQNEFLKMLEDGCPSHVYFLFTTAEPQKLIGTLKDRPKEIVVKPLNDENLNKLLDCVCKREKIKIDKEVFDKIIENSNGSARKALVHLDSVMNLKNKQDQLNAIISISAETQAFEIVRALLYNRKTTWKQMAAILKATEGEEPEQIRWLVLACCKTEMLKAGHFAARAYVVIDAFRENFYDSKAAGLAAACYEVIEGGKD